MMRFVELAVIILIVLLLFPSGKLPNMMGDLAKGLKAFKDGMKDDPLPPRKDDITPPPAA